MDSQPHWILLVVIGAVAWPILHTGWRFVVLLYQRRRPSDLCGTWYEYNLSREEGEVVLVREEWRVKSTLRARLAFRAVGESYTYAGQLTRERNHVLAKYDATEHEESVFCRFVLPAVSGSRKLVGLWVGFDFDGRLVAGPQLLSRDELPDDEARDRLARAAQVIGDDPLVCLSAPGAIALLGESEPVQ